MKALFLSLMLSPVIASAALVDPALQAFARGTTGAAKVLVLMDFHPTRPLPLQRDARGVKAYLQNETTFAWQRVQPGFQAALAAGQIRVTALNAINSSFQAVVSPAGLLALANAPGLTKIYAEGLIQKAQPLSRRLVNRRLEAAMPYDLIAMGIDQLLQTDPQLNGTGILVGHIDTGVDGNHPALAGKVSVFYDSGRGQRVPPVDEGEHGTHTAGTIVGNPKDGVPMGVAPGAKLVSVAGLTDYTSMIKGMEFMLDPDGNPQTNDVPRLVSNSWNCGNAPDLEAFYRAITSWEAAGILTVFSAGNAGPGAQTITRPHEHPFSFSIAATGQDGKVARFSSRGPGLYNGQKTQKPDVAAPGVEIVSSVPGGKYEAMSGTSMAAPHAAGLAALLFQLDPTLTPTKIREIMIQSANYVDEQGKPIPQAMWNPSYGFGGLNAVKAVAMVKAAQGRFERRWGTLMAPAVSLVSGLAEMSSLDYGVEIAQPATELLSAFPTDQSRWINGADL